MASGRRPADVRGWVGVSLLLGCAPSPTPRDLPTGAGALPTQLIAWLDRGAWTVVVLEAGRYALAPAGADCTLASDSWCPDDLTLPCAPNTALTLSPPGPDLGWIAH